MNLNRIFYKEVLDEWLLEKEKHIKYTTYCKYQYIINCNIKPTLGNILIKKLKNEDLSDFFNDIHISSLSDSTKKLIFIIINSSIKYAIKQKYRKPFVISNIKIKNPSTRIDYLTMKEQQSLEKYLNNNLNLRNITILFALYTGIRLGELCALQWKDIDFTNNTVYITKNVQRVKSNDIYKNNKTKLIVITPKTEHSIRIVPLPIFLINILKTFKSDKDNYIFTNLRKPKDPRALEKYFKSVLNKCGLRQMVFHTLRHTYATRSREAGIDIKILSELLGHSNYKVTLDIYIHTSLEFKKESVNSLVKYLKPKSSRN